MYACACCFGALPAVSARWFGRRCPGAPIAGLACWGSLLCAFAAACVAAARGATLLPPHAEFYGLLLLNGLLAAFAWVCVIKASQYVSAAEVGLLQLAALPLTPLAAYAATGAPPSPYPIASGLVLWAAFGLHGWRDATGARAQTQAAVSSDQGI